MSELRNKPLDIKFQKRFTQNLFSNLIFFILNIVVGLALVPYFLDTLGDSAYGLVPLATSLTSYVTLLIDAVNGAISRFLTIDLQRGDEKKANETFNTALFGTLVIIGVLTPLAIIAALCVPLFFDIGSVTPSDASLLFGLVFVSVLIRAWCSNFTLILFANNRLDFQNLVNIANLVLQTTFIIISFTLFGANVVYIGISYLIAAIIALLISIYLSHKICPQLRYSLKLFSKDRVKDILGLAGWSVIIKLGLVLRNHIALLVANITFGIVAGTEYSLTITWATLTIGIVGLLTKCFTPMIYSYRSKDDTKGMIHFVSLCVKITTIITAILIGLICMFGPQLLSFWVGEKYAHLSSLLLFVLIPVIFSVQSSCCAPINAAYLRVRIPALANILAGVTTVLLVIILSHFFPGLGTFGIAISVGITTFFISSVYSPIYGAYLLKTKRLTFVRSAIPGYLLLIIYLIIGNLMNHLFYITSIIMVIVIGSIIGILSFYLSSRILFSKDERKQLRSIIPKAIDNKIPSWIF